MRVDFPGLLVERHRNGRLRYRVRVEGDKARRIPVPPPDDPDFAHHYHAARAREVWTPQRQRHIAASLDWLVAGLPGRSSHGIRKAMAEMMAEAGCTQHQIMAVMAHTQAKTSEVYTKGAARKVLAADGIAALAGLEW